MTKQNDVMPEGVDLTDWNDYAKQRKQVFDQAKDAVSKQFPAVYNGVRLELHDLDYTDPEEYSLAEQKKALMQNKLLARRLRGTWKLYDDKSNTLLEERPATVMRVPYLTERGTWLHSGNEITTSNQARLLPGAYVRRQANGEIECHVNTRRGTGNSFRVRLEPETGLFKIDIGQSSLRLHSLLKDLGHDEKDMERRWGPELLRTNQEKYDARVFEKAYAKLVKRPNPLATREEKAEAIRQALSGSMLDRSVIARTLPSVLQKQAMAGPLVLPKDPNEKKQLTKDDLELLAALLDKHFHAGIPEGLSTAELVQAVMEEVQKEMSGANPELADALKQQHEI